MLLKEITTMKKINSRKEFRAAFLNFLASNGQGLVLGISAGVQSDLGSEKIREQARSLARCENLFSEFLSEFLQNTSPKQRHNIFAGRSFTLQSMFELE
jgi:hypothetical protein